MFPGQQGYGNGYGNDGFYMAGSDNYQAPYGQGQPSYPNYNDGWNQNQDQGQFPPSGNDFSGFPGQDYCERSLYGNDPGYANNGNGFGAPDFPPTNQGQCFPNDQFNQQPAPPMGTGAYGAPPPQMGYNDYSAYPNASQESYGTRAPLGAGGFGLHNYKPTRTKPQPAQQAASNVQLSNCLGRKRALLIGCNYTGSNNALRGCINDVHQIKQFLKDHFRFTESDMIILTDDQRDPSRRPTKENIIKGMRWLVNNPRKDDTYFFHFSGHGVSVPDRDGDEIDGMDEAICPVDFQQRGLIIDDEMNAIMVRPLPPGVRLTAIFDCCHSGSSLDLPYMYNCEGRLIKENVTSVVAGNTMEAAKAYLRGDMRSVMNGLNSSLKTVMGGQKAVNKTKKTKSSLADVVMFSGCKDNQTSADAKEDTKFIGAMSSALTASLYERPHQTYIQLLHDLRRRLQQKRHTQVPQLSTARVMDMNSIFVM